MATKAIMGREFLTMLKDAGMLPPETSRVVIDAKVDDVVRIYCQSYGRDDILKVIMPESLADAVKINVSEQKHHFLKALLGKLRPKRRITKNE